MYNRKPFIVFEGIEGSGKSLHSKSLIDQLKKKNSDLCYGKYKVKKQSLFKNFGSWINDKLANIVIKKGVTKNKAVAVAKGIIVRDI